MRTFAARMQLNEKPDWLMANIDYAKKEIAALRIVNRCCFLSEKWEQEWMMNAIRAAFRWSERHSVNIDPDSPYAIIRARKEDMETN